MGRHRGRHKIPTQYIDGFAVREIRPGYHLVDYMVDGTRYREGFADLADATAYCKSKRLEIRNKGTQALALNDQLRRDALDALKILEPVGASLVQAATEYAARHPATAGETFKETCDRYVQDMAKNGARPSSIADKEGKLKRICSLLGEMPTAGMDRRDFDGWAKSAGYGTGTALAYIGAGLSILAFWRGEKRQKRLTDETAPETWSAGTVAHIMAIAESEVPEFVPALAILFFAGVRPDEVKRLTFEACDMEGGEIFLSGDITKTRTMRHVEISSNLKAWLQAHKGSGKIVKSGVMYRVLRERVMKLAGIESWPVDVARHTYATMLYRLTRDVNKVMAQLGHFGSPDTFVKHYKGVPGTTAGVKAFWRIMPDTAKAKHQFRIADTKAG